MRSTCFCPALCRERAYRPCGESQVWVCRHKQAAGGCRRPAHRSQQPWDASPQLVLKTPHTTGSEHQSPGSPWESHSSDLGLQTRKLKPREDKLWLGPQAWPLCAGEATSALCLSLSPPSCVLSSHYFYLCVCLLPLSFNPFLFFSLSLCV